MRALTKAGRRVGCQEDLSGVERWIGLDLHSFRDICAFRYFSLFVSPCLAPTVTGCTGTDSYIDRTFFQVRPSFYPFLFSSFFVQNMDIYIYNIYVSYIYAVDTVCVCIRIHMFRD